jgi:Uncharacterized protein conserved in bacteria (DUF2130)
MILWESKRARYWSGTRIGKLKADQAAAHPDVAVLVYSALPADVRHMELVDGVWVVSFSCVTAIAAALRESLIGIAQARSVDDHQDEHGHARRQPTGSTLRGADGSARRVQAELSMNVDQERAQPRGVTADITGHLHILACGSHSPLAAFGLR